MADTTFKNHEIADLKMKEAIKIDADFSSIGYIPGYQKAEEERRAYYEDFKQRVEKGEFNGKDGAPGLPGPKGEDGTMTFEEFTDEQKESLRGPQGVPGNDYVLTDTDKQEISNLVLDSLPNGEEISY